MSKITLTIVCLFSWISFTYAQQGSGFGFKAGLNYNTSGKYFKDAREIFAHLGDNEGYHLGVFYQKKTLFGTFRPEFIFTRNQFETDLGQVKYHRVDLPILLRKKFFQVIGFSFGPSFHYTLSEKFSDPNLFESSDPLSLGFQLGLGANIGPLGLDLRFERELNQYKYTLGNVLGKKDYKRQQLILGLSFRIPDKK